MVPSPLPTQPPKVCVEVPAKVIIDSGVKLEAMAAVPEWAKSSANSLYMLVPSSAHEGPRSSF